VPSNVIRPEPLQVGQFTCPLPLHVGHVTLAAAATIKVEHKRKPTNTINSNDLIFMTPHLFQDLLFVSVLTTYYRL
jgi:hypothetical protein